MAATGILHQKLWDCPICNKPITGQFSYDIEFEEVNQGDMNVPATVNMTGVEFKHDCLPRTKRGV